MTTALSALFYIHIVFIYIDFYVLCYMCNYDYFHIFGLMECESKFTINICSLPLNCDAY